MASSLNPPPEAATRVQDLEYLYASNANVSNFVSVKLSGIHNYHLWKTQMLCLMETHDMRGLVDAAFDGPRASSKKIMKQYDSLLKGWIFGSVSEGVLGTIVDLESAKDVWDNLKSIYVPSGPSMRFRQGIASNLLEKFPKLAYANDQALMALARTFPSGLNHWETLIYPSLGDIHERVNKRTARLRSVYEDFLCEDVLECDDWRLLMWLPFAMLYVVYQSMHLLILMVHFLFFMVYSFLWKIATKLVEPIKDIDKKQKEWEEAKKVLVRVCEKISDDLLQLYDQPILEAARRNVYEVVDEFLVRSPKAIQSEDKKSGYDIIQLAIIHRSEKIYNLLYQIPKRKSRYRTFKDPSGNNMLHVAGRLAPSYELKRRTGAALQLQRELQWFEELKKLVFPAYITEENIYNETPEMVFTREHENLVKEGEKWMKTTAESCSITAALITTIVFAAAITIPGGSNQETGTPLFTSNAAFIVFATSDAISLFTSTTSLLVFVSILTARFAEEDFLVRLPRRLIIGLCTLFISTTAMMVAFSAALFLVFCDKKLWMLGPICGLACFPIVLFVSLQFPLIVDLVRSTYVPIFGNRYQTRFDADEVQAYFANSRHGKHKQKLLVKEKAVAEAIKGGEMPSPNVSG